jgi:predicted DNA binding CopG/RHH family protein
MARSKSSSEQKRAARPLAGEEKSIGIRLPGKLLEAVEAWASSNQTSRSEAIRRLIERGLAPQPPDPFATFEHAIARLKEAPGRD